ncbi:MAG TPA: metallophosphoesterase [Anaerolineales bacterium]|nr:metallophosphoesterase [Anaerolineales bacterium]
MRTKIIKISFIGLFLFSTVFSQHPNKVHAQSDKIVFAAIGDYGLAGQPLLDVSNLIKSWNPDFIVTLGDNNYPDGAAWSIDDNIGQYFHEYIFKYKGKYGEGSPTRRFYPSLGNHDWTTGANAYFNFFGYYNPVTHYDFIQGPVHFFIVDSDRNEPDGVMSDSAQAKWLKKTMLASTSPFNVVVFHHAPYSSGRHGSTEYMRWPFKDWGADVVLTGHDHVYERLSVNGIPYFVNGIGGAEIYNFDRILPESQVRYNQDFGAMRIEATSLYMKFQMYSRAGVLVDEYTIGGSNPSVSSITRLNAASTNLSGVNFQVNFSEAVTGVDVSDFLLTTNLSGANIASINGSGNAYTVTVNTGSGDGTLRLDLTDNDSILNSLSIPLGGSGAANGNFSAGEIYYIDHTSPSVSSIATASLNPSNAATVDFAVTFSEPVSGVDLADFSVSTTNGAVLTGISGSGMNYVLTVATGTGNDGLRLDFIDNDSVLDLAGNPTNVGFTSGGSYSIDRTAPVVTSITPLSQTNETSVDYAVSFSEPVTGVDGSDFFLFTMNGASITNVSGSGNQYLVSISLNPGSDSVRLDVNDNDSILDSVGNPLGGIGAFNGNFIGSTFNVAIDTPIATSIIRASNNPTNAANVNFIVTFSEPVDGVDIGDFILSPNAVITNITNSNPFYIITVNSENINGELKLQLNDDDTIHNAQGIPLGGNGIGNANFTTGETYLIDRISPQVTSIIRAGGNPAINPTADFIVTFSEPVNGVETSDFILTSSNVIQSSVVGMQNADPFYWVKVSTGIGSGSIRLGLLDNGNITDKAGNPLLNRNFTGESFNIAKTPVDFSAPTMNSVQGKLTNNPLVSISWSAVRNAQAYEVFVARDSNFSQIVFIQTTTSTSITPPTPLADGGYYVRVRAYNPDLNPGKFSKAINFAVDATPPVAPNLLSPASGATTTKRAWLKWSVVNSVVKYQIQVDNNSDFSSPEFDATTSKATIQTKSLPARTYYWRVRGIDSAGNWSAWSQTFLFTTK